MSSLPDGPGEEIDPSEVATPATLGGDRSQHGERGATAIAQEYRMKTEKESEVQKRGRDQDEEEKGVDDDDDNDEDDDGMVDLDEDEDQGEDEDEEGNFGGGSPMGTADSSNEKAFFSTDQTKQSSLLMNPASVQNLKKISENGGEHDMRREQPVKKKRKYKPRVRKHPVPFLSRLVQMFEEDPHLIRWSEGNIIIPDPKGLEKRLPTYFRHGNYNSFLRQLNNFGYNKVETCHGMCTVYVKVQGEQVRDIPGLLALRPRERKTERDRTISGACRGIFLTEEQQSAVDAAVAAALPQVRKQSLSSEQSVSTTTSRKNSFSQQIQQNGMHAHTPETDALFIPGRPPTAMTAPAGNAWSVMIPPVSTNSISPFIQARQPRNEAVPPPPSMIYSRFPPRPPMVKFQMPESGSQHPEIYQCPLPAPATMQQIPQLQLNSIFRHPQMIPPIVTPSNAVDTAATIETFAPAPSVHIKQPEEKNDSRMAEVEALLALRPREKEKGTTATSQEEQEQAKLNKSAVATSQAEQIKSKWLLSQTQSQAQQQPAPQLQIKIKRHDNVQQSQQQPTNAPPHMQVPNHQQNHFLKLDLSRGITHGRPPPIDIPDSNLSPAVTNHQAMLLEEIRDMRFKVAALEHEKYVAQGELEAMRHLFHGFRHCISCRAPMHQGIFASCGHFVCCHRCATLIFNRSTDAFWHSCPICKQNIGILLHPPAAPPGLLALQPNALRFTPSLPQADSNAPAPT